ncbi:NAD(P)-dependent oxidoreductase [Salibacterium aidingense]|uniref:NAD(P)-dependent oxidoreductase n=1 Tax=Salibacterium aidingense TaxID=384933 RepID=UPI00040E6982|nr:NAD(P)-dependent oxidoreductase [Salibacterium aidingense]
MKVSFIGLGVMGMGMALNLSKGKQGGKFDYLVCDINPRSLDPFKEKGLQTTTNTEDTSDSDYIFLCLQNSDIVKKVLLGENGLLSKMKPGQTIVDCSTISYLAVREIYENCDEAGIEYLDCPISGQHAKSMEGTLSIMCGGKEEVFNDVKSMLEMMGTQILYMGEAGAGQLTKMINNCAMNICIASFSELMPVGVKLGLEPEKLGDILMTATGASNASKTLIPKLLKGEFEHGFSLDKAYKDMESMIEVLSKYEIPLPTFNGTMQTYQLALQEGHRDKYKQAMVCFYEDMLGVKVREKELQLNEDQ